MVGRVEPLVSVCIPTYNNPEGLKKTLDCITGQTYRNLEIIISDNCSSNPEVLDIANEFFKNDRRIRLYHQFYNIGVDNNYRFVIGKTTGKYFMFAQDDDWWTPTYIQNLVSELERNLYSPVAACPSQYATAYGKSSPLHLLDHISVFNIIGNGNVGLVCMGLWNREVFIKCEVRLPAYVLGGDHMTVAHAILAYGNPVIADTERYIKGYKNGRFQVCFNNDFWYSFRSWYWFMKILIYSQYIPLHRKLLIPLIAITNFMKAGAVTAVQIIIGLPPSNPLRKYIQSKFFCAN